MDIPKLNVSVTKSAVNGQVFDVVDYDEYRSNYELYDGRTDVAIPVDFKGKEIILPIKGKYSSNTTMPGVYNAGCIDFVITPDEAFADRYVSKNSITMSNSDDIRDLILAGDSIKRMDEPFITTPDNITNIPIKPNDQPEMVCLKKALNAKHIDIDKYAARFGDNYPNDKRQLKSTSATLNIIKRYCKNCDMEAILILRDAGPDVPNPINGEISVSLTSENENNEDEETLSTIISESDEDDDYNEDDF